MPLQRKMMAYQFWDAKAILYGLASLTLVRMLPVALSMVGTPTDWPTRLFVGWFGPRGIASVLYLLMAVGVLGVGGYEYAFAVIILVILMSIVVHGVTAMPLVRRFAARSGA